MTDVVRHWASSQVVPCHWNGSVLQHVVGAARFGRRIPGPQPGRRADLRLRVPDCGGFMTIEEDVALVRWRHEIQDLARELHRDGYGGVALADALWILPPSKIAVAIEGACHEAAAHLGGMPRNADMGDRAVRFVIVYQPAALNRHLRTAVLAELGAAQGTLRAMGYDARAPLKSPRVPIPADRWPTLTADFEKSEAVGAGVQIVGIRVQRVDVVPALEPQRAGGLTTGALQHAAAERRWPEIVARYAVKLSEGMKPKDARSAVTTEMMLTYHDDYLRTELKKRKAEVSAPPEVS